MLEKWPKVQLGLLRTKDMLVKNVEIVDKVRTNLLAYSKTKFDGEKWNPSDISGHFDNTTLLTIP